MTETSEFLTDVCVIAKVCSNFPDDEDSAKIYLAVTQKALTNIKQIIFIWFGT